MEERLQEGNLQYYTGAATITVQLMSDNINRILSKMLTDSAFKFINVVASTNGWFVGGEINAETNYDILLFDFNKSFRTNCKCR
jgi:hypothetical protein